MTTHVFNLPDLGEGLEDAEIARWLVAVGDDVELNQTLVEADTAKALVEIPSPVSGKIAKLHASEGDTVEVGSPLITFEVAEDASGSSRKAVLVGYGVEEGEKPARRRRLGSRPSPPAESPPVAKVQAAPPVRKLAKEMGVDLSTIEGSGPGGRITRSDVLAAEGKDGETGEVIPVKGIRKLVAAKMSRSVAEIPHVTTYLDADFTEVLSEGAQREGASALGFVTAALVRTCSTYPKLNSSWSPDGDKILLHEHCHVGVATDTDEGLVVPVISDAQDLSVEQLTSKIASLAEAVRARKAAPEDLKGSTITISNVGSFGATSGTPIINHPEAAILALGVIQPRAVVVDNEVVARPVGTLSLSFDHRILDGAEAGRALVYLKELLEDPKALSQL